MEESVGSNSPVSVDNSRPPAATTPRCSNSAQQLADRITRALSHRLLLLHRSTTTTTNTAEFFVLGATGNVYVVTLSSTPTCTCPDRRTVPCKHIFFVFLRVLGLSLDDSCLRRRTLRPCQLRRLLLAPTSPDVLASDRARERFHQLFSNPGGGGARQKRKEADGISGGTCPVCLEDMGGGGEGGLATCGTCGNSLHEECLRKWKRSRGRRAATCVMCRSRWRQRKDQEQERYVNLAAYIGGNGDSGGGGLCAG